jgi:hypothetical protein
MGTDWLPRRDELLATLALDFLAVMAVSSSSGTLGSVYSDAVLLGQGSGQLASS